MNMQKQLELFTLLTTLVEEKEEEDLSEILGKLKRKSVSDMSVQEFLESSEFKTPQRIYQKAKPGSKNYEKDISKYLVTLGGFAMGNALDIVELIANAFAYSSGIPKRLRVDYNFSPIGEEDQNGIQELKIEAIVTINDTVIVDTNKEPNEVVINLANTLKKKEVKFSQL